MTFPIDQESRYLPCNNCLDDTEHNINVWDAWECVICGDVQPLGDEA